MRDWTRGGLSLRSPRSVECLRFPRVAAAQADNIELIMRFHPVGGGDISVLSTDFDSEAHTLEAIAGALDGQRGLVLARARYNRETGEDGMVINLANVVSV
jgi:hypothetical protein